MPKLQNCQFIQVSFDNTAVAGSSEEEKYKNWMEGFSPAGLSTFSGPDGVYFESCRFSILVTKDTKALYEAFLMRGKKEITITIIHRGSGPYDKDYEVQKCEYKKCKFNYLNFEMHEEQLFMNTSFDYEESVAVTFNVPNDKEKRLDKIGPITYNIPAKKIE